MWKHSIGTLCSLAAFPLQIIGSLWVACMGFIAGVVGYIALNFDGTDPINIAKAMMFPVSGAICTHLLLSATPKKNKP